MKKIFTFITAVLFCTMATAGTVGNEDNTTGWWSAFSDYYTLAPNKTLKLKFTNYTSKANNWNNWLAVVTTDADRNADGYSEYFVLRADNYGWNSTTNTFDNQTWFTSLTSNYNWNTFKDDMDGSTVNMTISRVGARVTLHADITTVGEADYYEEFVIDCGDGTQNIRAFLTTDGGHLVIDDDATTITDSEMPETITIQGTQIGETDLTTGWWSAFSDYYKLAKNQVLTLQFINYTNKVNSWNNWAFAATTDADRGDTENGYKEYFVVRADSYCWGAYGNSNDNADVYVLTNNYNWDTFKDDMYGAKVKLTLTRNGAQLTAHADITTVADTEYFENLEVANCDDGEQNIRAFLLIEGGCIDLLSAQITGGVDGIENVKMNNNSNGVRYNIAGQHVTADYKGLVIENGRKVLKK